MIKKKLKVNRGAAIPLGNDYFLMRGATHEQGGIDVGKDLEVENGEIIKVNPKSIKILSNAPIMNGISPAQMALGGLNSGNFEERFNKGFRYQESYKKRNKLNDDGTKKAKFGGEKDKLPQFTLGDITTEFYSSEPSFYEKTLPKVPLQKREESYDYDANKYRGVPQGFVDITDDFNNGEYWLYDNANFDVYKDPKTQRYYANKYGATGEVDLTGFEKYDYPTFRKMLPKRDYIGGDTDETRNKMWDKLPRVKSRVAELANEYGIDKNVLYHRLRKEGFIDHVTKDYNTKFSVKEQKNIDNMILDLYYNPFDSFGLDYAGGLLSEGKIKLLHNIPWTPQERDNEKGVIVPSLDTNNVNNALEIKAADMAYRQNELRKRGIKDKDINMYLNAAYNLGLYHKDLDETNWIKENYTVPNYYKLGGEMKTKQTKRNVSSTGGKKKALIGGNNYPLTGAVVTARQNQLPDLNWIGLKPNEPGIIVPKLNTNGIYNLGEFPTLDVPKYLEAPTGGLAIPQGYNKNGFKLPQSNVDGKISIWQANPNLVGNIVQGVANIGAATISGLVNRGMLNDLKYRPRPTLLQAGKLKTNFNINPQVREIKNTLDRYRRLIDKNTASSQVALARSRHGYVDALESLLGLRGQKENLETQLINQDILNQQEVANKNIVNYDNWLAGKYDFDNAIREKRSENVISGIQTGTQALSDFITNNAKWRNAMANIAALSAAYPNVTPERMAASGVYFPLYMKQRIAKGKRR